MCISHNFGLLSNKLSLVKEDKKDNNKISVNLISLYSLKIHLIIISYMKWTNQN